METETESIENKHTNSSSNDASEYDESSVFLGHNPDKDNMEEADRIQGVADRIKDWLKEGISREEKSVYKITSWKVCMYECIYIYCLKEYKMLWQGKATITNIDEININIKMKNKL